MGPNSSLMLGRPGSSFVVYQVNKFANYKFVDWYKFVDFGAKTSPGLRIRLRGRARSLLARKRQLREALFQSRNSLLCDTHEHCHPPSQVRRYPSERINSHSAGAPCPAPLPALRRPSGSRMRRQARRRC